MDRKTYYSNLLVRFNMINSVNLPAREVSVFRSNEEIKEKHYVPRIPCLRAGNVDMLLKLMEIYGVLDPKLNRTIYASASFIWWEYLGLAINQDHYITDNEITERNKLWAVKFDKAMRGQDFILDFDSPKLETAFNDTLKVCDYFEELHLPYSVNFSGKKGFHVRLDGYLIRESWVKAKVTPSSLQEAYSYVADGLKNMLKLETLDKSTLSKRQPVRVPYSLHSSGYVCLPLDAGQMDILKSKSVDQVYEMAKPENVLKLPLQDLDLYKSQKGYNRGLCTRNMREFTNANKKYSSLGRFFTAMGSI